MSLSIALCLQLALLATGGDTYAEAFRATAEKGCPLVVMVGASWCPACQEMKNRVIPEVRRQGALHKVAFAQVDLDEERELGTQLINGGPVPQILMYRKTGQGWKLRRLVGGHEAQAVGKFIAQGVEEDRKTLPAKSSPRWHPRGDNLEEARTASAHAAQEGARATTK